MNDVQRRHYDEFMQATKGYSAWTVAICVNRQTPGVDWRESSKGNMAAEYAKSKSPERFFVLYPHMARLDLKQLSKDLAASRPVQG